jgi:predicted nucleic acid-binding protein
VIVVSDTSPLAYLVAIQIVDCLPILYGQVYVPPAVAAELQHPSCPAANWMTKLPDWLKIMSPRCQLAELELDPGEREAIALALELDAEHLLIDERKGREAAKAVGLHVAGTLAVILDAANEGLCDGHGALDKLERTGFYASPDLLHEIRRRLT